MTREEAKKILKRIVNTSNELTHPVMLNTEMGAIKIAIEALSDVPGTNVGKWIYSYSNMICPVCNAEFDDEINYMCESGKMNYCPKCGAKMEVQDDN